MSGFADLRDLDVTFRPFDGPAPRGSGKPSPFDASWSSTVETLARELRALGATRIVVEIDGLEERDLRVEGNDAHDIGCLRNPMHWPDSRDGQPGYERETGGRDAPCSCDFAVARAALAAADRPEGTTPLDEAKAVYEAMARLLTSEGCRRQERGSGWWWAAGLDEEATVGGAVEQVLANYGIDTREPFPWETEFGWDATTPQEGNA